jgi:hypothetical protein
VDRETWFDFDRIRICEYTDNTADAGAKRSLLEDTADSVMATRSLESTFANARKRIGRSPPGKRPRNGKRAAEKPANFNAGYSELKQGQRLGLGPAHLRLIRLVSLNRYLLAAVVEFLTGAASLRTRTCPLEWKEPPVAVLASFRGFVGVK